MLESFTYFLRHCLLQREKITRAVVKPGIVGARARTVDYRASGLSADREIPITRFAMASVHFILRIDVLTLLSCIYLEHI